MSRRFRSIIVASLAFVAAACRPELDDDASRVEGPRILAVRAEPAEARPNEAVTLTALYTDGTQAAAVSGAPLGWTFCNARRALAEPSPVDLGCLSGAAATPLGGGERIAAKLSRDTCRAFGPDLPLAKAGEAAGRPADPDPTGGFFQPGLVTGPGASPTLFEVRIRCALPSVPQAVSLAFEQRYRANTNPEIASLERVRGDAVEPVGGELHAAPGEAVRIRVSWPECQGDAACSGAERYVAYDPATRTLADRRESLVVSWLTTSGTFSSPRTGRSEDDTTTSTESAFLAPRSGKSSIFVVLRDARGGIAYRTVAVTID